MTAQKQALHLKRRGSLAFRIFRMNTPLAAVLSITMALLSTTNFAAMASETVGDVHVSVAELEASSSDYRLASGDRLTILVYDQPQLSGQFIIDGGGGILLPLAGAVSLSGLTLAEAQKIIQDRFADGVLVQPAVNVRITDYRPIFVTGNVRKPGSYRFIIGQSVKAAMAAAGGKGEPLEFNFNNAMSEFITAEQRVRQLEADHAILVMRKARLEAQRDGNDNFVMPLLVGLTPSQRGLRSRLFRRERYFFAARRNVPGPTQVPAKSAAAH